MANARSNRARKSLTIRKVSNQLPQTLMVVAGMFVGHYVENTINSLAGKAAAATSVSGIGGLANKYLAPALLTLSGIVLPEFATGGAAKYFRSLGIGVSTYGMAKGLKEASGKDFLSGRGQNGMGLLTVYREPVVRLEEGDLPRLSGNRGVSL